MLLVAEPFQSGNIRRWVLLFFVLGWYLGAFKWQRVDIGVLIEGRVSPRPHTWNVWILASQ